MTQLIRFNWRNLHWIIEMLSIKYSAGSFSLIQIDFEVNHDPTPNTKDKPKDERKTESGITVWWNSKVKFYKSTCFVERKLSTPSSRMKMFSRETGDDSPSISILIDLNANSSSTITYCWIFAYLSWRINYISATRQNFFFAGGFCSCFLRARLICETDLPRKRKASLKFAWSGWVGEAFLPPPSALLRK